MVVWISLSEKSLEVGIPLFIYTECCFKILVSDIVNKNNFHLSWMKKLSWIMFDCEHGECLFAICDML